MEFSEQQIRRPVRRVVALGDSSFVRKYRHVGSVLQPCDLARGTPALRYGFDLHAKRVLIKTWIATAADDDLEDFWILELRALRRLDILTRTEDYLSQVIDSGRDEAGFHLVISLQDRELLPFRQDIGEHQTTSIDRAWKWACLARIARAIRKLHSFGIVHRNINKWSILTAGLAARDFQLTGFEWSTRISVIDPSSEATPSDEYDDRGLAKDWQDFSHLAAELLSIDVQRHPGAMIGDTLRDVGFDNSEFDLLAQLAKASRVDADRVVSAADSIAMSAGLQAQERSLDAYLVMPLGDDNALTRAIQSASDGKIGLSELEAQREFVEADLADAIAVSAASRQGGDFDFALRGTLLDYRVRDFNLIGNRGPSNWINAWCSTAQPSARASYRIIGQSRLGSVSIRITTPKDRDSDVIPENSAWLALRNQVRPREVVQQAESIGAHALLLNIVLRYLVAAANEFPVEIVSEPASFRRPQLTKFSLHLRARRDERRERLAELLGYNEPLGTRLHEALINESAILGDTWRLSEDTPNREGEADPTDWQFFASGSRRDFDRPYSFVGDSPAPNARNLYLVPLQVAGAAKQMRRQINAWRAYCADFEVQALLSDPRQILSETGEGLRIDQTQMLDEAKSEVLRKVVRTSPLFLVQGPPGVGKTRLVAALARELFSEKRATRILLSAQSHAAVDHLLDDMAELLKLTSEEGPWAVRCRVQEGKRVTRSFDVTARVQALAAQMQSASLLAGASPKLRERIRAFTESSKESKCIVGSVPMDLGRRAMEALLLRGANLVYATSNSGALERLIEDRADFDWVVIEESAKATGSELLNPLLLAHRRLLIGDHQQLPPFDSERMQTLLAKPSRVAKLLALAEDLGFRSLWDASISTLIRLYGHENPTGEALADVSILCDHARRMLLLFENLIEGKFSPTHLPDRDPVYVSSVWSQHRMHPAIADVVADAFYPGKLKTHDDCRKRFRDQASPVSFIARGSEVKAPIVWIKMPWAQSQHGNRRGGEHKPAYHNPDEVQAVIRTVMSLSVKPCRAPRRSAPTLAILSPYRHQVRALKRAIEQGPPDVQRHLEPFGKIGDSYIHTVDSFQGSQADVVVISLVRNNHRGGVLGALGFLADPRRMNVLFSRAKSRLMLVGCRHFLDEVVSRHCHGPEALSVEFLRRLLQSIDRAHQLKRAITLPFAPARKRRRHK